jgi:hypothetical protein
MNTKDQAAAVRPSEVIREFVASLEAARKGGQGVMGELRAVLASGRRPLPDEGSLAVDRDDEAALA